MLARSVNPKTAPIFQHPMKIVYITSILRNDKCCQTILIACCFFGVYILITSEVLLVRAPIPDSAYWWILYSDVPLEIPHS